MESTDFSKRLLDSAREMGVSLDPHQAELCHRHVALMLEWNRHVNLTRITDLREILTKHILDSLIPARWLPQSGLALDVGTGPGFPGVPLKILHPQLEMVLLEANHKKISFLKVLLSHLSLKNMWALHGRWEALRALKHPLSEKRYDLITMRAVRLESEHLTRLASELLAPGGTFAWWAGPASASEGKRLAPSLKGTGLEFSGNFPYALPSASKARQLLVWKKEL